MKGFFKFILSMFAFMATLVGAIAIADRFINKNRIKGDYLECDNTDEM